MISPAFASVLAANRLHCNRRIDAVRRATPGFDDGALAAFLADAIDPVVQAVPAPRAAATALAALDVALQLGVQDRSLGARTEQVAATWRQLAAPCAALLAAAPAQVLGMLANAVLHLVLHGARAGQWRDELGRHAAAVGTTAQLAALGQLLAWRAGMAHFRRGALAAAAALAPEVALAALQLPAHIRWEDAAAALARDPWWTADGNRAGHVEAGAFAGLGGAFDEPPRVRPAGDGFVVAGGARHHLLSVDRQGAVLHPASAPEFDAAPERGDHPHVRLDGATVHIGSRALALDLPADGLRVVCNDHTAAVTSPYTHAIRLLPLP